MSAARDGTLQQLPYTRCADDGAAMLSLTPRKRSSTASTTGSINVGACPTLDDQGRARQTLERGPQRRPQRRTVLYPLLDVGLGRPFLGISYGLVSHSSALSGSGKHTESQEHVQILLSTWQYCCRARVAPATPGQYNALQKAGGAKYLGYIAQVEQRHARGDSAMPAVMIIGASRGIGLELARQYANAGWRVHATTRTPARPGPLGALAGDMVLHALEVRDAVQITALVAAVEHEGIDVLIHNAGV